MRLTDVIIGCIVLTLTILPLKSSLASIGEVTQSEGSGVIDRKDGDKGIVVEKELDVFSYDTVKTGNGKVGIEFIDATRVDVTQHSKLIIDEFVYDPNTKTGKLSLKAKLLFRGKIVRVKTMHPIIKCVSRICNYSCI